MHRILKASASAKTYADNMTESDRIARGLESNDIATIYSNLLHVTVPSNIEHLLFTALAAANASMQKHNVRADVRNLLRDIHVAIVSDETENGMPFTLGKVIFMPISLFSLSQAFVTDVILHELLHVYQRANSSTMLRLLETIGYAPASHETSVNIKRRHFLRNNPDTTHTPLWVRNGLVPSYMYSSERPRSLRDGRYCWIDSATYEIMQDKNDEFDHPYEAMADMFPTMLSDAAPSNTNNAMAAAIREFLTQPAGIQDPGIYDGV